MTPFDPLLVAAGLLLLLAVLGSKASGRFGVPAALVFLVVGMLAGSEGPGGIAFDDPELTQLVGIIALSFILFSGGLDTRWDDVRPVLGHGAALATVGVALTALTVGVFSAWLLGLPPVVGLLLGAIVSSTDAAAVFSVLRSRGVGIQRRVRSLLELESGSNDPMAVFLTIALTAAVVDSRMGPLRLLGFFVQQMALGALLGLVIARATVWTVNRIRLDYQGLYPVLTVTSVLLAYAVTSWLGGSGFLAVYIAGLNLGTTDFLHKQSLRAFHDAVAWVMQITMFLALGLLVFPSELLRVALPSLAVAAVLMLAARPLAVFATMFRGGWSVREKTLVSWVGLRGAVPIVLATFPLVAGAPHAGTIFNVVFFIVLLSVIAQGMSIPQMARWLRLDTSVAEAPVRPMEYIRWGKAAGDLVEVKVEDGARAVGKRIVDLALPQGFLIVLVTRGDDYVVPQGDTILRSGDRLLVLGDEPVIAAVQAVCSDGS
jgi:potassium/hydrogen antiporter